MHKTDVVRLVAAKLAELAVPRHISSVREVPSKVRVQIFMRNTLYKWDLRSRITRPELEQKLGELTTAWELHRQGQIDLEDLTR
jgi:hypothetical protein